MLEAVEGWWLAALLRRSFVTYPLVNAAHILSIGALVTSALLMDLRVLGLGRGLPVATVIGHLRPVAVIALVGAVATGGLLFAVQATTYPENPAFRLKLLLLAATVANAVLFTLLRPEATGRPLLARAMALASIAGWLAVLAAGRFIGFLA